MTNGLAFNCALVTGGAGGIGKAMAEYLLAKGKKVLLAGRTESKLKQTAAEINATGYYVLDTGKVSEMPAFVAKLLQDHPDLDCLINNAGVQRELHILDDEPGAMLAKADEEIDINIRGPMHLAVALLPHLEAQSGGGGAPTIVNVSSILGFVPFSVINPVYCGTKAWLHFWSVDLRTQLARRGSRVRVVEVAPPTVATDLHRDRADPDDNKKDKNPATLSVDEFIGEVMPRMEAGETTIGPGVAKGVVAKWYDAYGEDYRKRVGGSDEEIAAKAQSKSEA